MDKEVPAAPLYFEEIFFKRIPKVIHENAWLKGKNSQYPRNISLRRVMQWEIGNRICEYVFSLLDYFLK